MSQDTATIIPFPSNLVQQATSTPAPSGRLKRLAKLQVAENRTAASLSQAVFQAMAMCGPTPDLLPDPAVVAQVVIGFARRKGIAMTSIPKIFREQLLALCVAGDPTALMLRDWLEGNRKLRDGDLLLALGQVTENGEGV